MKRNPTVRRVRRTLDLDLLAILLERLESALPDPVEPHPHLAVAVMGLDDGGVDLAVRELDSGDVVEAVAGFEAPASWLAFGLVCGGRSRPALDTGPAWRPDPQASPERVHIGVLMARSGISASGLRVAGGAFTALPCGEGPIGRIPDACRRVLGLGTPPPQVPVEEAWATLWLHEVLVVALARPGVLRWADVVELHPGVVPPDERGSRAWEDGPGQLLADAHALGVRCSWEALRHARSLDPGPGRATTAWMDEGMFSREVLGAFPTLASLRAELEPILAPDVLGSIDGWLGRWGLA